MPRFFIELAYQGKNYHGWQKQNNANTIQQTIEEALSILLKQSVEIVGSGRTDTGVNAKKQIAHFDFDNEIDSQKITHSLNALLPKDIGVYSIFEVKSEAHARFSAQQREYHYFLSTQPNPFWVDRAWYFPHKLNIEELNKSAQLLHGYKDFQCFSKTNTDVKHFFCEVYSAEWEQKNDLLIFKITADRFLRNMVRSIVGTLLEIGQGKKNQQDLQHIIEGKNRSSAGQSVPAEGLYLWDVIYPTDIYLDKK